MTHLLMNPPIRNAGNPNCRAATSKIPMALPPAREGVTQMTEINNALTEVDAGRPCESIVRQTDCLGLKLHPICYY
jgi:hypothetical protein